MGYSDNPSPDYRDTLNHHLHGALEFTMVNCNLLGFTSEKSGGAPQSGEAEMTEWLLVEASSDSSESSARDPNGEQPIE